MSIHRMKARSYTPRIGAEQVLAAGRVALVAVSLLLLALDPTTPASHAGAAAWLLLGYLVWAVVVYGAVRLRPGWIGRSWLATHVVDLLAFSALVHLTEGPNSPYFLFFTFSLIVAAVRWRWRGVVWTAAAVLGLYGLSGLYAAQVLEDPVFHLDRFVVRSIHLALVAAALAYLGWHQERLRGELRSLASWPVLPPRRGRRLLAESLRNAAAVTRSRRALVVWEDREEPWTRVDVWAEGRLRSWRFGPESETVDVAADLEALDFIVAGAGTGGPVVWVSTPGGMTRWQGRPIDGRMFLRYGLADVLSLRVYGSHARGRLYVMREGEFSADDCVTGRIVADRVTGMLENLLLGRRLREAAAREERTRLSRDLHDGLLQSLTGAALQLQTVDALWARAPSQARERLRAVQRLVADEQRDLRFFIDGLRPGRKGVEHGSGLHRRLHDLGERFQSVWNLEVSWELPTTDGSLAAGARAEVYSIIQEALANSARHGQATRALVRIEEGGGQVRLRVADNGIGFRFHGRYGHEELRALRIGPVSLRERVAAMGGRLAVESDAHGARLEIELPRKQEKRGNGDESGHR